MGSPSPEFALNAIGRTPALPKVIALDLDDTLNNFTETLKAQPFPYDRSFGLSENIYQEYLERIRHDRPDDGDLLSTPYSFLRYKIHAECYRFARARRDGVEFTRWLKENGWKIIICTRRDLRRAHDVTRRWLEENGIPFDDLFMVLNKIVFCKAWGIGHLVDDDVFNIHHAGTYGLNVYYPIMEKHRALVSHPARGFTNFHEVKTWIQN